MGHDGTWRMAMGPILLILALTACTGPTDGDTDPVVVETDEPENMAPLAYAGQDLAVYRGDAVSLSASGSSDPEGASLMWTWTQLSGEPVTLAEDGAAAAFDAPRVTGALVFQVEVTDGELSSTDDLSIDVQNRAPSAIAAGGGAVLKGSTVTIDASASKDPDGDALGWLWSQSAGDTMALADTTAESGSFNAPATAQTLTFEVTVSDGELEASASLDVVVLNLDPIAIAGADQTSGRGVEVTLDASASVDPDDEPLSYAWTQTSGEAVSLSDANVAAPTFTAPAVIGCRPPGSVGPRVLSRRLRTRKKPPHTTSPRSDSRMPPSARSLRFAGREGGLFVPPSPRGRDTARGWLRTRSAFCIAWPTTRSSDCAILRPRCH